MPRLAWCVATAALVMVFVAGCGTTVTTSPSSTATSLGGVATSSSPTPSAPASATPGSDAAWVSYSSAANHLTFQHPAQLHPLECGWVWVDATTATSCPQGDGLCCVFFRSSDNRQTGSISLISDHPNLYSGGIRRTAVVVDGVSGTRLSATQTSGQGGGPQVEYDFTTKGRTYNLFAYVGGESNSLVASAPSASVFDQIVQTLTFTN